MSGFSSHGVACWAKAGAASATSAAATITGFVEIRIMSFHPPELFCPHAHAASRLEQITNDVEPSTRCHL
jgi:hypothetical protein